MCSTFLYFIFLIASNPRQQGVATNGANNSFTLSCHYFGICKKERIWVLKMVISVSSLSIIPNRYILLNSLTLCLWVVQLFINGNVHFLKENTVCWNSISCIYLDYVTNNQVFDRNGFAGAILTTVDAHKLLVHLLHEQ